MANPRSAPRPQGVPMLSVHSAPGLPPAAPTMQVGTSARHPALRFLVRRLVTGILTLLIASLLIFLATNILPGNAAVVVLGRNAAPAQVHRLEAELGINRPVPARYLSWLGGMVQGNFGQSAVARAEGRPNSAISATL